MACVKLAMTFSPKGFLSHQVGVTAARLNRACPTSLMPSSAPIRISGNSNDLRGSLRRRPGGRLTRQDLNDWDSHARCPV